MIGTTVGGYQVTRLLAEGGMGAVWAAKHPVMGRDAVVKLLLPELSHNAEMVRRFFNEARAAAAIKDPGIVQVFDVGHLPDGRAYIVMERLEGQTLADRLRTQRPQHAADPLHGLRVEETVNVLRLIARTLDAAHAHGIVHRDLKPDNIFLVPDRDVAGGERTKVLDFGIAKLADTTGTHATRAGSIFGTPAYMAPEQCSDAATVDARADLYAVGCIAYEMLCGQPPFGLGGLEILASHMRDEPVPLRQRNPAVPPALEAVVARLLRKLPAERYQSSAELFAALDGVALAGVAPTMTPLPFGATAPTQASAQVSTQISVPPGQSVPLGAAVAPGTQPPAGSHAGGGVPSQPAPSWAPSTSGLPAQPPITTYTAANGSLATPSVVVTSKRPYVVAVLAIAAAAAVVAFVLLRGQDDRPAAPVAALPVVEQANVLAEAERANSEQRWEDAITAAGRVTRDRDLDRARVLAERARVQLQHRALLAEVERALAAGDLAAARQVTSTISADGPYRRRGEQLVAAAEQQARDAALAAAETPEPSRRDPKRDPKQDRRKEPKQDPKPPAVVVKAPDPRPPEDDTPKLGFEEAMMTARNALKREQYGTALKHAQAALRDRGGDGEAQMIATIAACGLGQRARAAALLPKDRSSWREVAMSRCFKIGMNLE